MPAINAIPDGYKINRSEIYSWAGDISLAGRKHFRGEQGWSDLRER